MKKPIARSIAMLTAVATLAASAPAAAEVMAAVAYGTGATSCSFAVSESRRLINFGGITYDYAGETDCSVAVQQSGVAALYSRGSQLDSAPLCSGFQKTCRSSDDYFTVSVNDTPPDRVDYQVHLIAPFGQGWETVPDQCAGVGTDNLSCTFTRTLTIFGIASI